MRNETLNNDFTSTDKKNCSFKFKGKNILLILLKNNNNNKKNKL